MCYFDTESNSLMNIELASYCGNVLVMLELMQVLITMSTVLPLYPFSTL